MKDQYERERFLLELKQEKHLTVLVNDDVLVDACFSKEELKSTVFDDASFLCSYFEKLFAIQEKTNCEIVQCIGLKIVLYKMSTRKGFKHIQLN